MKKWILLIIIVLLLTGCVGKEDDETINSDLLSYEYVDYEDGNKVTKKIDYYETSKATNYVLIDTSKGKIIVELYPEVAPITVKNFKSLVKNGFYKDFIFHRVIKNFMIQTGDPTGTGTGGSGKTIKGEFSNNGVENNLSHTRGVISMARSNDKNSASSQFFIVQRNSISLDGDYAAFGRVIAGMEVVDSIATVKTNSNDKPIVDQKLNNIIFINIVK